MTQGFEPIAFKETTRQQCQNAAVGWRLWTSIKVTFSEGH